jgi:L-carnitine CoA-transferase
MWENEKLPKFGCLQGVKVVHATASMAGPFSAQLLADYGADVIWLESALAPDLSRSSFNYGMEAERRNQRNLALNTPSEKGKEIFLKLLESADVFIESSKTGQYEKWGLTDEVLWQANPKLVICHVSGFGQTGLREYTSRPSYDIIAQAFSGFVATNMNPVSDPYAVGPYAGDFFTGLFAAVGVLAALYRARETGVGESVDVAQYECMMRTQIMGVDFLTAGTPQLRAGDPAVYGGVGAYKCKDGAYVMMSTGGAGVLKRTCEFFNVLYGDEAIPVNSALTYKGQPGGDRLDAAINAYLADRTAKEASDEMIAAGLSAQQVHSLADLGDDPQVQQRQVIEEFKSYKGVDVKTVGPLPKFTNNPAYTWRPAPYQGMDNEEILGELGYSAEEIAAFYEDKTIGHDPEMKYVYPYSRPGLG